MNIGIFGGTFNPPHRGHVTMAQAAISHLALDTLHVIPAAVPPHKPLPPGSATTEQRWEMSQLLAGAIGKTAVADDREMHRSGKSYTVHTLQELRGEYGAEARFYLLMGSDMFLSLHTWHMPETICKEACIVAFHRSDEDEAAAFDAQKARLERDYGAQVLLLDNPALVEVSSTQLRQELCRGGGEELLSEAVWGYVQRHRLYGVQRDLHHLTAAQLRPIALSYLKPKRMAHVLGTEDTAAALARRYGTDEEEARIAALLHDCTKKLDMEQQLALCEQYGIELDEMEKQALKLLHSRTGAELARREFVVSDTVYRAIRYHTTGRADMTMEEKILYIADYIEPNRSFDGVEAVREATAQSIDRGILLGLEMTIEEMAALGNPIHHLTLEARDYLIRQEETL